MNEEIILNKAIDLMNDNSTLAAYNYLTKEMKTCPNLSGQYYNFLYCLASLLEYKEEALDWMEEAIVGKGLWYRPEVFEDEDLDHIRQEGRFQAYVKASKKRYDLAMISTKTVSTWQKVTGKNILLALHGNQQNNEISQEKWCFIDDEMLQVEYLQSKDIDSCGLYRWDSGKDQILKAISNIKWQAYDKRILTGFSAGSNAILETITDPRINDEIDCLILQSPWIPCINSHLNEITNIIASKKIAVLVICGLEDEDCRPHAEKFIESSVNKGCKIQVIWIEGLSHEEPDNFQEIIREYLKGIVFI